MSYVDYLSYRMKWDEPLRSDIAAMIIQPVDTIKDIRYRATRVAENNELLDGLAKVDFDHAIDVALNIDSITIRKLALGKLHDNLINQGMSWEEATSEMRSFIPDYERKIVQN